MPEGYDDFVAGSAARFLTDTGGENAVYSPLSAYMALAMLAELTDGESRNQLLGALGAGEPGGAAHRRQRALGGRVQRRPGC